MIDLDREYNNILNDNGYEKTFKMMLSDIKHLKNSEDKLLQDLGNLYAEIKRKDIIIDYLDNKLKELGE